MFASRDRLKAVVDPIHRPAPDVEGIPLAAVAAVFRAGSADTEVLFIQRATKAADPWSGQMAFPGGRWEPTDPSPQATARRETIEETGLDLTPAEALGALTDLEGGRANNRHITVSAHCFWLDGPRPDLTPNYEVADTVWVELGELINRERFIDYVYPATEMTFPGIQLDKPQQVVWGLTLRFLADLFHRLETDFIVERLG